MFILNKEVKIQLIAFYLTTYTFQLVLLFYHFDSFNQMSKKQLINRQLFKKDGLKRIKKSQKLTLTKQKRKVLLSSKHNEQATTHTNTLLQLITTLISISSIISLGYKSAIKKFFDIIKKIPNNKTNHMKSDQMYEIDEYFFSQEVESLIELLSNEHRCQSIQSDMNSDGFGTIESIEMTKDNSSMAVEDELLLEVNSIIQTKTKKKNSKPHLSNIRRKKEQREVLKNLTQVAIQSSKSTLTQNQLDSLPQNTGQLTKNLLPFAKYSHMQFLESKLGKQYFQKNPWLNQIKNKDGMTLTDYDKLYSCEQLKEQLKEFFSQKILYRELMTSRTIPVYKVLYMYFLEIFEANFNQGGFKGISVIKVSNEKNRSKKLNKPIKKN